MEETNCSQRSLVIQDLSQVSEARRIAQSMANDLQLNEIRRGQAGIIVTEAARNVFLHGRGGEIVLCPWTDNEGGGLDIVAIDKGPGMEDVARCLRDGYSTTGTSGNGLGAISRLADRFEIWSAAGQGTAILARVLNKRNPSPDSFLTGTISVPITGETECGDNWAELHTVDRSVFIVTDGLGHGRAAAEASREAIKVFRQVPELSPEKMLLRIHNALKSTRGAAAAIAEIDIPQRQIRYAGVGNILASVWSNGTSHSMASHNGTLGHNHLRVQEFSYLWPAQSILIMHSDGLNSHWDLRRYPGLAFKQPRLLAAVLYRDSKRGRDDATILVSRESSK